MANVLANAYFHSQHTHRATAFIYIVKSSLPTWLCSLIPSYFSYFSSVLITSVFTCYLLNEKPTANK